MKIFVDIKYDMWHNSYLSLNFKTMSAATATADATTTASAANKTCIYERKMTVVSRKHQGITRGALWQRLMTSATDPAHHYHFSFEDRY